MRRAAFWSGTVESTMSARGAAMRYRISRKNGEGEFAFIDWIRRRAGRPAGRVLVGPGDDAAVVRLASPRVVIHVDNTVEGAHYPRGTPWRAVGWKSVMRCASDIAAMGCRPVAVLAGAVLPRRLERRDRRAIVSGMLAACRAGGMDLVGGDLTAIGSGPTMLSVTVFGEAPRGKRPIRRSGARPGDLIGVTGRLGGSILGRHLRVRPRIREALALQEALTLHAMIDVSDGFAADLSHVLDESGVGARIDAARIPVHPDAKRLARRTGRPPLAHALGDGEDHELLFAFSAPDEARLPARVAGCAVTVVGRILPRREGRWMELPDKSSARLCPSGFSHEW